MTYPLGIDIGTTYTAAALWRDGRVQTVPLGDRANAVPSVLFLRPDGTVLIGDAAVRRGLAEPERQARGFKRRMGDDVPVMLGGTGIPAHQLIGRVLRWTVDKVAELQGGPPSHVVLTHPAEWGSYRRSLLIEAARGVGLRTVGLLPEPVAAATWYAAQERIEPGALIGVYDFGGGTFDATVVRKTATGVEIHGEPGGDDSIGGVDFDHALFRHVAAAAGVDVTGNDPALAHLFQSVVDAKEALSSDTEALVSVVLPGVTRQVLVTRPEFEGLIRSRVAGTVGVFGQVVARAGVDVSALRAVLLVGGSSRIPLVRDMLTRDLGVRRVAVDAHPKYTVSLGAAIAAAPRMAPPPRAHAPGPPPPRRPGPRQPGMPVEGVPSSPAPVPLAPVSGLPTWTPAVEERVDLAARGLTDVKVDMAPSSVVVRTRETAGSRSRGRLVGVLLLVGVLAVAAGIVYVATREGSPDSVPLPSVSDEVPVTFAGELRLSGGLIAAPEGTDAVNSVAVVGGARIAVGRSERQEPRAWVDGSPVAVPFQDQGVVADVVGHRGRVVAVGWTGAGAARRPAVWTSSDGRSWALAPPSGEVAPSAAVRELVAVAVAPDGRFLAFGVDKGEDSVNGDTAVLASGDGVSWTRVAATGLSGTGPQNVARVARTSDGLVAVGSALVSGASLSPAVWTSAEGVGWRQSPYAPEGSATLTGVAESEGALWACGAVGSADRPEVGCWRQPAKQEWERWEVRGEPVPLLSYALVATPDGLLLTGTGRADGVTDAAVWTVGQ